MVFEGVRLQLRRRFAHGAGLVCEVRRLLVPAWAHIVCDVPGLENGFSTAERLAPYVSAVGMYSPGPRSDLSFGFTGLRHADAPPAVNVVLVVRVHAELIGARINDPVVDRADGRIGLRVHGREDIDNRHHGAIAVVQRVADAGLRSGGAAAVLWRFPWSRREQ